MASKEKPREKVCELISEALPVNHVVHLSAKTFEDSLSEILEGLIPNASPAIRKSLGESMLYREKLRPTLLPHGAAFPRAEARCTKDVLCAVGFSEHGICVANDADTPVRALFVSLYPEGGFRSFVPVLDNLVRFSHDPEGMASLRERPRIEQTSQTIQENALPWNFREWLHAQLVLPFSGMRNLIETLVRVRHD